jgi:hypothetical protein
MGIILCYLRLEHLPAMNGLQSLLAAIEVAVREKRMRTLGKEFILKLCHFGHPNFIPVLGDASGIAKSA